MAEKPTESTRRAYLAGIGSVSVGALTAGYLTPSDPRTTEIATGTGAAVTQEDPSGEQVLEIVREEFSAPLGVNAVARFEALREEDFESVVVAGKQVAREHVEYYNQEADEDYRAYLENFIASERGLENWYEDYESPTFNSWLEFVIPHLGEENYVYQVASFDAFEPGTNEFKYTFGGDRGYDPENNILTLQGTSFEGFDRSEYIVEFESDDTEETGATLVEFGHQVRMALFQFFEDANAGEISDEQTNQFNEIVAIAGGCNVFVNSSVPYYYPLREHQKMLNNLNRLAVTLSEWGYEPTGGFRLG